MKNKEIKKPAAELDDDALEQITGGTYVTHEAQQMPTQHVESPGTTSEPVRAGGNFGFQSPVDIANCANSLTMYHDKDPLGKPNDKIQSIR